ncbi:uncharacterized protein LOC124633831 isoform X1 [Helicoverpa zea]|uniref:uncharacterized protein LOC124633831 isoform X1 n=2 Tax=Helicoverpa zea TaxID=7113 RepID=UPI001F5676A1|nr:uncharacterized protein LOC124633831 isoform X1 [Helicoverpa zea]
MYYFDKHVILILCAMVVAKAERWYSATIIERRDSYHNSSNTDFRPSYIQNNEHNFMPLVLIDPKKSEFKRNDYFTASDSHNGDIRSDNNAPLNPSDRILNFNNSIENINVLHRIRPKRKLVRKKCPAVKPRLSKQLNSKPKSKTRFLEVFQVVEFDHVSCVSSSGLEGTCLPEAECIESGGSTMGTCADGYGTCCVTQFACDDRSAAESGWFTNPDFPSPSTERLSCAFALDKASEDVKQIRLDFSNFELLPPTDGSCQYDQFIVSGQNINNIIPILCGINSGQHVYIEVGDVEGPIYLTFQTVSSDSRLFSIKVTQLTSSDELAAPSGCLQYYTEPQGYLESFNYRDKSDIVIAKTPSYLNNLNYAMCIERKAETCSVTYTNTGTMEIVNYDTYGLPVIPPGQAGVEILNCPNDWLLITATRLCGDRLNDGSVFQDFTVDAPITDNNAGPIVVWFHSDESYVGDGFKLMYQQNPCNT